MPLRHAAAAVALAAATVLACSSPPPPTLTRVSEGRVAMGTVLQMTLEVQDPERGRALLDELFAEVAHIEAVLTTWDPASPTVAFNRAAGSGVQPIPALLREALEASMRAASETDGAFDVTLGPLIALWRSAAESARWPSDDELAAAHTRTGIGRLRLAPGGASLAPGMAVDFGGLGKGMALDRLAERLAAEHVPAALLDFGGSSWLARGAPRGEHAWQVLVASPTGERRVVSLRDESLSVSESLGGSLEIEGRRIGHVIDPRSGQPVEHAQLAAVRAPTGTAAEIWSTALLVLPPGAGLARIEARPAFEAWLQMANGSSIATAGFGGAILAPLPSEPDR